MLRGKAVQDRMVQGTERRMDLIQELKIRKTLQKEGAIFLSTNSLNVAAKQSEIEEGHKMAAAAGIAAAEMPTSTQQVRRDYCVFIFTGSLDCEML